MQTYLRYHRFIKPNTVRVDKTNKLNQVFLFKMSLDVVLLKFLKYSCNSVVSRITWSLQTALNNNAEQSLY